MATWIFQANPKTFDLDGYLRVAAVITWNVRERHLADHINVGDRVFVWRAEAEGMAPAGVIAAGYILEPPRVRPEHEATLRFWREPQEAEALRVLLRVERHATKAKEIVRRDWLANDPVLRGLLILKMASDTNYAIELEHAQRLEALWRNTGRDWNEPESIAGLWAYARTMGGEVSQKPAAPVAQVALRIGRAVTSVYNKVMNFRHLDPGDQRAGLSGAGETDRRVWAAFYDATSRQLDAERLDTEYARLWGAGGAAAPVDIEPAEEEGLPPAIARERSRVQGYEPDAAVRRAVELRAMVLAEEHYRARGFAVENTASTKPYDFRCTIDGLEVRVEVKGTRGDGAAVEVTIGEVENARGTDWRTDLFVVSGIVVTRADGAPVASGGTARIIEGWRPAPNDLEAIRFRCVVPLSR